MPNPDVKLWQWQFGAPQKGDAAPFEKTRLEFSEIAGWEQDDHAAAFLAFRQSCEKLAAMASENSRLSAIRDAALSLGLKLSSNEARHFFEANFAPHLIERPQAGAIITGYFEPEIAGSLERTDEFTIPIYALPEDLVLLENPSDREGLPAGLTAARAAGAKLVPYHTRQDIEEGALAGAGLEIAFLADAIDAFIMHVQGSGMIRFPGGKAMRVGFAGKNGHPYTSIGKVLIERGELDASNASLDALVKWMQADAERGRRLMWENKSYVFFRALDDEDAALGPHGALRVPLTAGRSLAVDPRYHQLGLPIWVSAPGLKDMEGRPFERLMIAQDTGSAIRGAVRGDIFWGEGAAAGRIAGETKHPCDFYILIPN